MLHFSTEPLEEQSSAFSPPEPKTIEETGLDMGFLSDLILKVLYFQGYRTGVEVAEVIKLPFQGIIDNVMTFLKREQMIEIKGGQGLGKASYEYAITSRGSMRAREVLNRNQYIGPAPVPLHVYNRAIRRQTAQQVHVNPKTIRRRCRTWSLRIRFLTRSARR